MSILFRDVRDVEFDGTVRAQTFIGDGSALTALPHGLGDGTIRRLHAEIDIRAPVTVGGALTATAFRGDGSRLENIDAAKVTAGVLDDARIPNFDASKIIGGVFPEARIPTLTASQIDRGVFEVARVPDLDASKITGGVFSEARVPTLAASHIDRGVLHRDRIPTLHATQVSMGVFDIARIPVVPTSKIGTGVFDITRVPNLPATKITSGVLDQARLPASIDAIDIRKSLDISGDVRVGSGFRASPHVDGDGAVAWGAVHFASGRESFATIREDATTFRPKRGVFVNSLEATDSIRASSVIAETFVGSGESLKNIDAGAISRGVLAVDRVPGLDASKITGGVFDVARIPEIPATRISRGGDVLHADVIPRLDASKIAGGRLAPERLPERFSVHASFMDAGVLDVARVPNLDASKISSGTLAPERLPDIPGALLVPGSVAPEALRPLDASKIATGTIDPARLPKPDESVLPLARVPRIPATHIDGVLAPANIPSLTFDAGAVVSGVLAPERVPPMHATKLIGKIDAAAVPFLDAGLLVTGRVRREVLPDLDASMIATGTIDPARLPPIGAADISRGVFNPGRIPDLDASKITTGVLRKSCVPRLDPEHMPPFQSMCTGDIVFPGTAYVNYVKPGTTTSKPLKNALERVRSMRSVIDATGVPRIADLRTAFPEAFRDDESSAVDYSRIIALLVEAIKELDLLCFPRT